LIHGIAADVIGVSADFNVESRIGKQNASDFCQLLARARLQRIIPVSNRTSDMLTMSPRALSRV